MEKTAKEFLSDYDKEFEIELPKQPDELPLAPTNHTKEEEKE